MDIMCGGGGSQIYDITEMKKTYQVRDRNPAYEPAANMDSTLTAEANDKNEDPRSNSVDDYDYMG